MKATTLLRQQHHEVKGLFERLAKAPARNKRGIFEEIAHDLVAHDAIEREIFYPACEAGMGMTEQLAEALVEHGVVEFSLYQADEARPGEEFDAKCKVLKELLEHHIEEEETEFFPKVERALGRERLDELGVEMKARFEKVKAGAFRRPLHANLRQVMAGAMKTRSPTNVRRPMTRATKRSAPRRGRPAA